MDTDFEMRNQHFVKAGDRIRIMVEPGSTLIIPEYARGLVAVQSVSVSTPNEVVIVAGESLFYDPEDFVITKEQVEFNIYRERLASFMEYKESIRNGMKDFV